jgi:transcriptional regulator with XRE-family HTH domain
MTTGEVTFGQTISKARKSKSLSQKDLAGIILKEEDGTPISPQYLNDIEHDRRSPTSDHLIRQFAKALDLEEGLLFVLAGKIPDDIRKRIKNTEHVVSAFMSFRTSVTKK